MTGSWGVWTGLAMLALTGCAKAAPEGFEWLPATPESLPRWRGFNLLEKFIKGNNNGPFKEDDFRMIHELGFNFVRLPMDYRTWSVDGDWTKFDEAVLKDIDQAVAYGEKWGVHVNIAFHRIPGYTVANPKEATSLWTDAETQRVAALHWRTFAKRYAGIPSERVSFNLMNEPAGVDQDVYLAVVKQLVDAIRAEDPQRLIISDGLQWGGNTLPELKTMRVAQATRGYAPMEISHYQASWVNGEQFAMPTWPLRQAPGLLVAPSKPDMAEGVAGGAVTINGGFASESKLRLHVMAVSGRADLVVEADGREVWRHEFVCGPGEGEWKEAIHKPAWDVWQNIYDRDYETAIPAGTKQVAIKVVEGDWLQLTELGLTSAGGAEVTQSMEQSWNVMPAALTFDGKTIGGGRERGRQWLKDEVLGPWAAAKANGQGVMVGEWGAFNKTPHDVVLAWMEDCLKNWQEAGMGWALWNFRGSFGVLDSGRADVVYEEFQGHQLDRKMMDLLQRY